jgi:hypothetical protein
VSTAWKPLLHTLKEQRDKQTIHNNPSATWHASFYTPHSPYPPTLNRPLPTPQLVDQLEPKPWHWYKYCASSHCPHFKSSPWRCNWHRVLKRRLTKIWHRGDTQKNTHNIQHTAKIWNQVHKIYDYS